MSFPITGKKSNLVPIQKRGSKNFIENYRPIILLIFSKVFESLISNSLFNHFIQNKLFTDCQSGCIPADSYVAQLLSITHEICKCFGCNLRHDMRVTFLDISKAFDKVWDKSVIFKVCVRYFHKILIFSPNDSSSKTMKNAFYFI